MKVILLIAYKEMKVKSIEVSCTAKREELFAVTSALWPLVRQRGTEREREIDA